MQALETLEKAERELKLLLKESPELISIGKKNSKAHVSDALASCQGSIRSLLKSGLTE